MLNSRNKPDQSKNGAERVNLSLIMTASKIESEQNQSHSETEHSIICASLDFAIPHDCNLCGRNVLAEIANLLFDE
jgi:hypothetical protein